MNFLFSLILLFNSASADNDFSLDTYKGKVIYLDFWASWCGPCKDSFPWLNEIQKKYKDQGLVVVGINLDKDAEKANEFLKKYPAQFTVFFNSNGDLAKKYGVKGMPYTVLIGKDGMPAHSHIGFHADKTSEYIQSIEGALK